MAKKGERVGTMGDSVYYRTPDGQIIDDQGNVIKGPMAKMMADEYESKQQEKAKAQAEAKAAAEEAKRQKAAEKAAEIARKAAEKEAALRQRQQEQEARRQEAQAAAEARRQQAEANRQRASNVRNQGKLSAPTTQQTQQAPAKPTNGPTAVDEIKGAFKSAAMNVGRTAFDAAFPTISKSINYPNSPNAAGGATDATDGSVRQAVNRVADEVNTTNMMLQTSIARQETTNQILGSILKEVQQIKKPSLLDAAADALSSIGTPGAAKGSGKVAPKSGVMGAAGSVLRRAPIIGALLGGGLSGYDEYQESGNAGRAISTGVGSAAGGGLGAWGGASAGAALGAFGGPVGMAIGGLLGAAAGGLGGSWLGGKAGKGAYDMLAPGPSASADIKEAQATKLESKDPKNPSDSIVNMKTLTFNADNIVFNAKTQQGIQPNQPAVTNENKTNTNATGTTNTGAAQVSNVSLQPAVAAGPSNATGVGVASPVSNATRSNTGNATGGGDQIEQILATIRKRESGGNYQAKAKTSSASGAYQFIDSTWQSLTKKFGIGTQFKSAGLAPKETQDAVARNYVQEILQKNNGDVSKVPLVWYTGNAQGKMSASALAANGGLTPQAYQSKWMNDFGAAGNMQADSSRTQTPGGGSSIIDSARQQAGTQSFSVMPGQAAPARVQPNQNIQMASTGKPGTGGMSDASAVQLAETMVGKTRGQSLDFLRAGGYNNQGEAWCAQFVNSTLKQTGGQGSGSAVANSFQNWGTSVDPSQVQPGDVVLQTRGKAAGQTGGHVGIATGVYRNGQVEMIAGNTSGAVRKYMVPVNAQLMVRRGAGTGTQLAGADKNKADPTVGGTPGAIKPSTDATSAKLTPKESQALQTASLQPAGASKGAELNQASTKDMADQRSAKQGITVNQQTMSTPVTDGTQGKYSSGDVGIVEPVDARARLKELFGLNIG